MTHNEIATACLADITLCAVSGRVSKADLKAATDKAHNLICEALAAQSRDLQTAALARHEEARQAMSFDGVHHKPKAST